MILANKRILVTGADGFIGSHLTELLLAQNLKVTALCQYNSFGFNGWIDGLEHQNLDIINGDIRDPFFCNQVTKDIDVIFHLAALIAIPYSYIAPESYVSTNILGTVNLLEGAKKNKCERFIHTSTSEVYGTANYVPIDELHPMQPQSPYSASKISADSMALSYYNSFNFPLIIARPFNTYGPRQSARAVIPTIISQIASGKKEIVLGDLSPTRDFNYVLDTCRGFLEIAKCDQLVGETVNLGSNYEISIKDTLNLISEIMGKNVIFLEDSKRLRPKKSEVFRLWCDNKKIKEYTGFQPKYDLKSGLSQTIDWFLDPKNLELYKSEKYNV